MMSTQKMLSTRMLTAIQTWASHPDVYVEVIATNNGTINQEQELMMAKLGVKITQLPNVNDHTYPPQKKSFSLLKHMYDTHLTRWTNAYIENFLQLHNINNDFFLLL